MLSWGLCSPGSPCRFSQGWRAIPEQGTKVLRLLYHPQSAQSLTSLYWSDIIGCPFWLQADLWAVPHLKHGLCSKKDFCLTIPGSLVAKTT